MTKLRKYNEQNRCWRYRLTVEFTVPNQLTGPRMGRFDMALTDYIDEVLDGMLDRTQFNCHAEEKPKP